MVLGWVESYHTATRRVDTAGTLPDEVRRRHGGRGSVAGQLPARSPALLVLAATPPIYSLAQNCAKAPPGLAGGWDGGSVSGTTAVDISPFDNDGIAGGLSLGTEFWIGGDSYNDNFFAGLIDEAQVYNRVLTASEIQAIFDTGSAGVCKLATVCHRPGTHAEATMLVPAQAAAGLNHGDTAGACPTGRPLN